MLENLQQTFYDKYFALRIITAQLTTLEKISWYSSLEMSFLITHDKSSKEVAQVSRQKCAHHGWILWVKAKISLPLAYSSQGMQMQIYVINALCWFSCSTSQASWKFSFSLPELTEPLLTDWKHSLKLRISESLPIPQHFSSHNTGWFASPKFTIWHT